MTTIYALRIVVEVLEEVRWVYAGVVGWLSVDCKLAEMDCAICGQLDHDLDCERHPPSNRVKLSETDAESS